MSMSKDEIWWDTLHQLMDDYENNPEALTTHINNRVSEDYAALEQELTYSQMATEAEAQIADELKQERDGLKAYCEELKTVIAVLAESAEMVSGPDSKAPDVAKRVVKDMAELLNKSPLTCLAEVEARAVESLAGTVIADGADHYLLKQHAKQLREEAKK